jgi:hypothetical protein
VERVGGAIIRHSCAYNIYVLFAISTFPRAYVTEARLGGGTSFLFKQILTGSIISGWASLCGVLGRYSSLGYIVGIIAGGVPFLLVYGPGFAILILPVAQDRDYTRSDSGSWGCSPLRELLVNDMYVKVCVWVRRYRPFGLFSPLPLISHHPLAR